jgi:hypothetical protein
MTETFLNTFNNYSQVSINPWSAPLSLQDGAGNCEMVYYLYLYVLSKKLQNDGFVFFMYLIITVPRRLQ